MKQLFQTLSRTGDGAFVINEQQQIIFWNREAQTILGYTAEEVIGRLCYEILGGHDDQGHRLCRRYCRMAIGAVHGDTLPNTDVYTFTRETVGCWLNVTTIAFPVADEESRKVIVHLFRDATQNKSNQRFVAEIMAVTKELRSENERPDFSLTPTEFSSKPDFDSLTPRERQVLLLLAQGSSTDEIATMLNISPATIRNHIQNILDKLGVHSRLEAVTYAYQQGLIGGNS